MNPGLSSIALCILALAASVGAFAGPRDPSVVFTAIDNAIAAHDYYKTNSLLGELMNNLLAAGVPPLTGAGHRQAMEAGRQNRDLAGLVQSARASWAQATRSEQRWEEVMVRLSEALSSAAALDVALPPALRYDQARIRYEARPSIIFLHQLTLRAFEAGEYAAASKYVFHERNEIPRAYSEEAGPILNRSETLAGVLELKNGNVAGAIQALKKSADALKQYPRRRLPQPPRMLLAQQLLHEGQFAPVVAYLDVCAQFEYPGGEEYTDMGRNPSSPAQLKAAILAGKEPQFQPGTLLID